MVYTSLWSVDYTEADIVKVRPMGWVVYVYSPPPLPPLADMPQVVQPSSMQCVHDAEKDCTAAKSSDSVVQSMKLQQGPFPVTENDHETTLSYCLILINHTTYIQGLFQKTSQGEQKRKFGGGD